MITSPVLKCSVIIYYMDVWTPAARKTDIYINVLILWIVMLQQ